jgi:uncharacterized sulfatase
MINHAQPFTAPKATPRALAFLLAALFALLANPLHAAESRPNIIVILTDDQGWADLGAQGIRQDIHTPNLDALAAGGLRASNGYVSAPQCVPSRAGLITGRHQQRFGVDTNLSKLDGFDTQLTLPARLKKAGYATGMSGKWHLGPIEKVTEHGFDDVFCTQPSTGLNLRAWANFGLDGQTTPGAFVNRTDLYHLEANASAACAFIDRHAHEPFFFYLAFRAPHTPLDAPDSYVARFPGPMPERRRHALGAMAAIDDGVGRVMAALRQHQLEEKTLVFFLSDNGAPLSLTMPDTPYNADNGGWDGSLNAPMNGEKGMLTEGGMREPWLAYWKGVIPAGQVYERPVISLDIAATANALANLPADPQLDGVNLIPFFTGENKSVPHPVLHWRWSAESAIREGNWKLLIAGPRSYLFDLGVDPSEQHNLIAQHPDIAQDLRSKLVAWSGELQPPGIDIAPVSRSIENWFDFSLDGKRTPKTPAVASTWVVRNALAEVKDGALHVVPPTTGKQHSFVAFTGFQISGPATATASLYSEKGGQVGIEWRLSDQKNFSPEQTIHQTLSASANVQEIALPIPAKGTIVHVRLLLPDGITDVRRFEVKSDQGKSSKQWSFETANEE